MGSVASKRANETSLDQSGFVPGASTAEHRRQPNRRLAATNPVVLAGQLAADRLRYPHDRTLLEPAADPRPGPVGISFS